MPRNDLTLLEKENLLKQYDLLKKCTQRQAAAELGVSQSLLNKLLKNRHAIKSFGNKNRKRKRSGKDEDLEKALKKWYVEVHDKDVPVTGPILRSKAASFAEKLGKTSFKVTDGWFSRWLRRENIVLGKSREEHEAETDEKNADDWIATEWPGIRENYEPCHVYNAHETGLNFRAVPGHHRNACKERMTLLCCASMSGEKSTLLVIGEDQNPPCFENVKKLPVDYRANKNACLTREIFAEWLQNWNDSLEIENRRILLLVNNCKTRRDLPVFNNIKIVYLPTNFIQPCDQGIIRMFKVNYRKVMLKRTIDLLDCKQDQQTNEAVKKLNLLEALHLANEAWNSVTSQTIMNCFEAAGFLSQDKSQVNVITCTPDNAFIPPEGMSEATFNNWLSMDDDQNALESQTMTENDSVFEGDRNDSCEDDVKDELQKAPTKREMLNALGILRRGVQHLSDSFSEHYEYEKFILQMIENHKGTNEE